MRMTDQSTLTLAACDGAPAGELPAAEALRLILAAVRPVTDTEVVPLWEADGRTLAAALLSPLDVPNHTNSAVDGYAVRGADVAGTGEVELELVGRVLAGHRFDGLVEPGQCVAITTGATMPEGADSVVMQEYTQTDASRVRILRPCRPRDNVRQAGEDIQQGAEVAAPGTRLTPALLGVLASLGLDSVTVLRRPLVAVFSTGDEVQPPGTPLKPGGVYDANRFALRGLLAEAGVDMLDLGLVPDEPGALRATLAEAARRSDAVITSGGVSVGEADHIKPVLAELGQVAFWKLAIKPGRPLTFGELGGSLFFGLPGNPVAVMVTFLQFVRPALQRLAGMEPSPLTPLRAVCTDSLRKRPGRREFQRAIATAAADGRLHVALTGRQGSGILTSMSRANCLIVLPETQQDVAAGDMVDIELLPWARVGQEAP
jgi:molybdopterin molybdotransferase